MVFFRRIRYWPAGRRLRALAFLLKSCDSFLYLFPPAPSPSSCLPPPTHPHTAIFSLSHTHPSFPHFSFSLRPPVSLPSQRRRLSPLAPSAPPPPPPSSGEGVWLTTAIASRSPRQSGHASVSAFDRPPLSVLMRTRLPLGRQRYPSVSAPMAFVNMWPSRPPSVRAAAAAARGCSRNGADAGAGGALGGRSLNP